MLTTHAIPEGEPVLAGHLAMHRLGPEKGRPVATIRATCPYCHSSHSATLPDIFPLDFAVPIVAPCRLGPLAGRTVHLALDPTRAAEARRLMRAHGQALRRYRVELSLRLQLSESRALDRRHAREWPDATPADL